MLRGILLGFLSVFVSFMFISPVEVSADKWFDSYGDIPWEEERLHLDNFAAYLSRNKDMRGYIAYYPGKNDDVNKVRERVNKAQEYVECVRRVGNDRVVVVNAGTRESLKIVLQPVSQHVAPPDFE